MAATPCSRFWKMTWSNLMGTAQVTLWLRPSVPWGPARGYGWLCLSRDNEPSLCITITRGHQTETHMLPGKCWVTEYYGNDSTKGNRLRISTLWSRRTVSINTAAFRAILMNKICYLVVIGKNVKFRQSDINLTQYQIVWSPKWTAALQDTQKSRLTLRCLLILGSVASWGPIMSLYFQMLL